MSNENRKWIIGIIFVIAIVLCVDVEGTVINNFSNGNIWQIINGNTITQNDTSLNVRLGTNASSLSKKLWVDGDTYLNGLLDVTGNVVFNYDVQIDNNLNISNDLKVIGDSIFGGHTLFDDIVQFSIEPEIEGVYLSDNSFLENGLYILKHTIGYNSKIVFSNSTYSFPIFLPNQNSIIKLNETNDNLDIYSNKNITLNTSNVNTNGSINALNFSGYGIVPIGSVQMFLLNLTNTPLLPTGWELCDGHTCNDIDSVYNGVVIPNLNNITYVVGNTSSGEYLGNNTWIMSIDQLVPHSHYFLRYALGGSTGTSMSSQTKYVGTMSSYDTGGGQPIDNKPYSYTVVYILRVK